MGFKWPALIHTIHDAAGYPGVEVEIILNPEPLEPAEYSGKTWDTAWFHQQARIFERLTIPEQYREDGKTLVIEEIDAEKLWQLDQDPEFDNRILLWVANRYAQLRYSALPDAVKN